MRRIAICILLTLAAVIAGAATGAAIALRFHTEIRIPISRFLEL